MQEANPGTIANSTALSQLPTTYDVFPAASLSAFLALQGWQDLTPSVYAADQALDAKTQQLKNAVALYEAQPNSRNAKDLQLALLTAKKESEKGLAYAREQRDLYQAQVQARAQQPISYSQWVLHRVQDFFGSSPEALVEKYAAEAEKQRTHLAQLEAGIAFLAQEIVERETALLAGPNRRLLSQTTPTNNTAVTVANPIPNQIVNIAQSYTYSLNNVFSGSYTLLSAPGLPSWLSLQYPLIGSYTDLREADAVVVSDNTLFVTGISFSNSSLLLILDVSTPSTPVLLGNYTYPLFPTSNINGLVVSNNTVFLFGGTDLLMLDVSTPSYPQLLGSYNNLTLASDIAVSGSLVLVADHPAGLMILDVSTPNMPVLLGSYANVSWACGIAVSGNTVFMADGYNGKVWILNVTTPSIPSLLSNYTSLDLSCGIAVSSNILFVGNTNSLLILNISTPSNPQLVNIYQSPLLVTGKITISGNTLFAVAGGYQGLSIFDVSTPNNPTLLNTYPSGLNNCLDVFVSGNTIFMADGTAGVLILDVSLGQLTGSPIGNLGDKVDITVNARNVKTVLVNATFTLTLDKLPYMVETTLSDQSILPSHPLSLRLGASLFVNPSNSFLHLSVQSNPGQPPTWLTVVPAPLAMGSYTPTQWGSTSYSAIKIVISGNTLFLVHGGLSIIDVSTPSTPQLLGQLASANDVVISGDIAFVADWFGGLQVLNVASPNAPQFLGSYVGVGSAQRVAISNNVLFLTDSIVGLLILDVSTPSTPILLANYTIDRWTNSIAASGNTIFLVGSNLELVILDVSAPSMPQLLYSSGNQGDGLDIIVVDSTVFLLTFNGLLILDVSLLTDPQLVGSYPSLWGQPPMTSLAISGNTLFVTKQSVGLLILDVSTPSVPRLIGSYADTSLPVYVSVALSGSIVFTVDLRTGLLILDASQWLLTATPTSTDVGNYPLQLVATDTLGGTASASFTIRVEGSPQVRHHIPLQYAPVGQSFNYFVPQGGFYDPNGDPISFTAFQTNHSTLPSWLSFNGVSAGFAGNPSISDLGTWNLTINATDSVAGTPTTNTTFLIFVGNTIPAAMPLHAGRPFNFSVPISTFAVEGVDIQGIQAAPLQPWLTFDPTTLTFKGMPPLNTTQAFSLPLMVTATTAQNDTIPASMSFLVVPNSPLQIVPISVQTATVGTKFSLVVPPNTFTNPNGYPLTYSASGVPSWLTFDASVDPPTFSGTPGYADTNFYALRILQISLSATDGVVSGSTVFVQQVGGVSTGQRVITIAAPIISAFSTMFTAYRLRALALNRCFKKRYQKLNQAETHAVGEEFSVQLSTPSDKIYGVAVKVPNERRGCSHFFRLPRALPGGFVLPLWLEYDEDTNTLHTTKPIPAGAADKKYVVQVCGKGGVIVEQFDFNIAPSQDIELSADGAESSVQPTTSSSSSKWMPLDSPIHQGEHTKRKHQHHERQQSVDETPDHGIEMSAM